MDRAALLSPVTTTLPLHPVDPNAHPGLADVARNAEPFHHQVAGHRNVLADASGSLIIKPALAREIAFYQLVQSSSHPSARGAAPLARLEPFLAQFYGTLRLEGCLPEPTADLAAMRPVEAQKTQESVVLENLVRHYSRPNILDVKLGTVMHGPDATPAKKLKTQRDVETTTSKDTGLRLTGFQTWHAPSRSYILTSKTYGKSITAAQLPEGMARFFPLPKDEIPDLVSPASVVGSAPLSNTSSSEAPSDGVVPVASTSLTAASGSNDTHTQRINDSSFSSGNDSIPKTFTDHASPPELLLEVLQLVAAYINELITTINSIEARFVASSVLIIYEGDVQRLREGLEQREEKEARRKQRLLRRAEERGPRPSGQDGEVDTEEDDGSSFFDSDDSDESNSDSDYSEDESDSPTARPGQLDNDGQVHAGRRRRKCPAVTVKLIDFAHTRLVEGEGPDEGVLLGLRSFRGLLEGRIRVVKAALQPGKAAH